MCEWCIVESARRGTMLIGPRVAKHPDRTMIGTDRFLAWHFDPGVGRTVAEITRRIPGQVPADLREALAYQTADRVFGPHLIAHSASRQRLGNVVIDVGPGPLP